MDIAFTEQDRSFQKEVSDWLETSWPKEMRDGGPTGLGPVDKSERFGTVPAPSINMRGWADQAPVVKGKRLGARLAGPAQNILSPPDGSQRF